jgi:hypothetical protein
VIASRKNPGLMTLDQAMRAAARWTKSSTLFLDPRHAAFGLAQKHEKKRNIAAQLVARLILLERRGPLSAKVNDAWLAPEEAT